MEADPIEAFAAAARAYCEFVDRAASLPISERLSSARVRLLELYTAALSLPTMPEPGETDAGAKAPPPDNWPGFESKELYWEVFDPYEHEDTQPGCGELSDDFLDIYGDVHRGLALWDASHKTDAIWSWRFLFDFHWGDHAINALRALHWACGQSARTAGSLQRPRNLE